MSTSPNYPYQNASLPVDTRVQDLLARMTLEEKIGQLQLSSKEKNNGEKLATAIRAGRLGNVILASSAFAGSEEQAGVEIKECNEMVRIAFEESRLGIPLLFGRDVIHGHRTVFPIPLAQAATWDPASVQLGCEIAAREARSQSIHWTYSPMVDISRDPRWGRIAEGYGEDPYLTSVLGAAAVHGYQGQEETNLREPGRLLACVKHFVGYGAAEGGRDYNTVEISDYTLRNIYLPPFRAAIQAGVASLMCGFHDLGGVPMSGDRRMLTEILREEWGFPGFVVSDWWSVHELINHGVAADEAHTAEMAINAGVDMDMCSNRFDHLPDLIEAGRVALKQVDTATSRVLRAKFLLGLFETPFTDETEAQRVMRRPDHLAAARKIASRGMVLLKNDRAVLPLPKSGAKIAVVGPLIDERRALLGTWTLDGEASQTSTVAEAIRAAAPDAQLSFAAGSADIGKVVRFADVAVVVVGETHSRSGENASLSNVVLPHGQDALIQEIAGYGIPFVVVVLTGRPLVLNTAAQLADGILVAWHSGSETAAAIADLLFGEVSPSGKLPVSFPAATGQIPIYYNHTNTGRPHGGCGWYQDAPSEPLYPFGFGLSYTSFSYSALELSAREITRDEAVTVRVTVTNTGSRPGEEIAQLYLRDLVASRTRPVRELKGFQRVDLESGESRQIEFQITSNELGFFLEDGRFIVEPGEFSIWVGGDSRAGLSTILTLR